MPVSHEQNGVPGVTTRLLSKMVNEIHVSFAETVAHLPGGVAAKPIHLSGNPTRAGLDGRSRVEALEFFSLPSDGDKPTLLVFGGSLGARSINAAVEKNLAELSGRVRIIWQTGADDYDRVSALPGVSATGGAVRNSSGIVAAPYIDRMDMAYAAADVVLCRAGATTIAELTRIGKPAILVPYPHAAGGHQMANARVLGAAGAALVIEDSMISGALMDGVVKLTDKAALQAMAARSQALGKPDAAARIAERVFALAGGAGRAGQDGVAGS